ncbi:CLUMA_CG007838, isoform A [Clunio marinus]|uniref:CLUMA_CG007838, isoform A n=1 Tax=Clunio marinus TaxID=568069 RepID=A0A1J1I284_9DIPT|nr:CLUMA_CG007838, isoform A [Clunio marinus]
MRMKSASKPRMKVLRKDEKQPTLLNFFKKISGDYFTTHKQSSLPAQRQEDLSMSQFLEVDLVEGDDPLNESDLKPKEGIEFNCISDQITSISEPGALEALMNKIYSPDHNVQQINMDKQLVAVASESEEEEKEDTISKSTTKTKSKKKPICPKYKIIESSLFAVDAFRFGDISFVEHYFLTHFHADHYIGLRKKFKHKIYLSQITALLVQQFIGVAEEQLQVVHVNVPFFIDDVKITPLDANHCPGALLFLFQFPDGRNVLHTGDFRANDEMVQLLEGWSIKLDLVYLDTTYLSSKRRMPSQGESIEFLLQHVQKYLEENIGEKFLIVVGAYLIGKEKVWMSIVKRFNFKVYLEKERLKAFKAVCSCSAEHLDVYKRFVTENIEEADVRVVNMVQLSYPNLKEFLRDNQDNFNTLLGVVASGWENQKYASGRISLLHVQYSEHSSYGELETFISRTNPKNIISTVPVRMNAAITHDIPKDWTSNNVIANKKVSQRKLTKTNK